MEVCDVGSNDLRDLLEQAHKQSSTNEEIADETNRYAGLTTLVEDVKE